TSAQIPHADPAMRLRDLWQWWRVRYLAGTLLQSLGEENADRAARALARGIHRLNPPRRRDIEQTLETVLRVDAAWSRTLSRQIFEQMARFWVELLYLPRQMGGDAWQDRVEIVSPDAWRSLGGARRGLVLVTPVLGNPAAGVVVLN